MMHAASEPTCLRCQRDPTLTTLCLRCASSLAQHAGKLPALQALRVEVPGLRLHDGLHAMYKAGLFHPPPLVEPDVDTLLVTLADRTIDAIEAGWDGDTEGWGVRLSAVAGGGEVSLAWLRHPAGDIRLFTGDTSWPEARMAETVGRALADRLGVPFWFPSPSTPDLDAARYWERDDAVPCADCGLLLSPKTAAGRRGRCEGCAT